MAGYLPAQANAFVAVGTYCVSEFWFVLPPNHNCKYLVRILHIEIHKSGHTFRLNGKMSASNTSADGGAFAKVIFSFCRS